MKNVLAALAVVFAPVLAPALAADGTNIAGGDEESLDEKIKTLTDMVTTLTTKVDALTTNVGHANGSKTGCSAASPCGLLGRMDNLTTDVSNLANRGQVAVVRTIPDRPVGVGNNHTAHYYLLGNSTIPGFPVAVAADGKFAENDSRLPAGDYLFEMYQPSSDQVVCQGRIFRSASCPRFSIYVWDGTTGARSKNFNHGSAAFTVTSNAPNRPSVSVRYRFPPGTTFTTDRPLSSYIGGVKITRLK